MRAWLRLGVNCKTCGDRVVVFELLDDPEGANPALVFDLLHAALAREAEEVTSRPGRGYTYVHHCDRCGRSLQVSSETALAELVSAWNDAERTGAPSSRRLNA